MIFLKSIASVHWKYVKAGMSKGCIIGPGRGEIDNFTGISSPYEEPENADLVVNTSLLDLDQCVEKVIELLESRGVIASS